MERETARKCKTKRLSAAILGRICWVSLFIPFCSVSHCEVTRMHRPIAEAHSTQLLHASICDSYHSPYYVNDFIFNKEAN